MMRRLTMAFLLSAAPAVAQITPLLPEVDNEDREYFRGCRAAIFYHLDPRAERDVVPIAVAEAMREQMTFIMSETLRQAPVANLQDGAEMLNFAENFFLSFSATLRTMAHLARDVAAREQRLLACQPLIWMIMGEHIDRLMAHRQNSVSP